ncbi:MAG: hypothetical protein WC184_02225 [Acidimicrobiia bacterium]
MVEAERDCCLFFSLALTVDSGGISLEVTAPPEGASMSATVFGEALLTWEAS